MKYRLHRFDMKMTKGKDMLESFLNSIKGEVVAYIPNVGVQFMNFHRVDFVLVVEKGG